MVISRIKSNNLFIKLKYQCVKNNLIYYKLNQYLNISNISNLLLMTLLHSESIYIYSYIKHR